MAKITVTVQVGEYPGEDDRIVHKSLSKQIMRHCFESLDHPSRNADAVVRELICTSTAERKKVFLTRKEIASLLASALTEAIVECMGQRDTVMGYRPDG